ncbi:MAG TPA: hypothetical protein VG294_17855 [Solirubrobacteraceae bacterium]|jgi:hypothetical protein|nr:hypothetical protein [Solirubrobacteraceae bacterium]
MTGRAEDTASQQVYRREARILAELGAVLARASLAPIEVRLPRPLAEQAVAAWDREEDEGPLDPESYEQYVQRGRAATLSLIGLCIAQGGRWEDDSVVVDLPPTFVGAACDAADEL